MVQSPVRQGVTIAAEDLTFAYGARHAPVLNAVTLRCDPGSMTVLTGPSGSGKSTLLYVLALLLGVRHGRVLWDGKRAESLPDTERARLRAAHSGFVFQDALLDPTRTVVDNVCEAALFAGMPRREAQRLADVLLKEFGVLHRSTHKPAEISGGQAQRVALCRALVTDPGVIFADEPTGNLDDASAHIVWDALERRAKAGSTVIVATHDTRLVSRANHLVELA